MTGEKEQEEKGGNGPIRSENAPESGDPYADNWVGGAEMSQAGKWGFSTFADELQVKYLYSVQ